MILRLSTAATTEAFRGAVQRLVSGGGKWSGIVLICRTTSPLDALSALQSLSMPGIIVSQFPQLFRRNYAVRQLSLLTSRAVTSSGIGSLSDANSPSASISRACGRSRRGRQPPSRHYHEDRFPRPGPNGRCRFGQENFAGVRGNGREAPKADNHRARLIRLCQPQSLLTGLRPKA